MRGTILRHPPFAPTWPIPRWWQQHDAPLGGGSTFSVKPVRFDRFQHAQPDGQQRERQRKPMWNTGSRDASTPLLHQCSAATRRGQCVSVRFQRTGRRTGHQSKFETKIHRRHYQIDRERWPVVEAGQFDSVGDGGQCSDNAGHEESTADSRPDEEANHSADWHEFNAAQRRTHVT